MTVPTRAKTIPAVPPPTTITANGDRWPWALHPLLQAPAILLVDTLRRHSPTVERIQDRYARWRRETWWRNEMGDRQSHFKPAERLRQRTRTGQASKGV